MSDEAWKALAIIVPSAFVLVGRIWSHYEHRGTNKKMDEIHFMLNGKDETENDEIQ